MIDRQSTQIAAAATTSGAVPLSGQLLCGLFTPPGMTGTAVTFLAAPTAAGPFARVGDGAGAAYSRTFAAGDFVPLDPAQFSGLDFVKVVSGAAEAGARDLTLCLRQG